MKSITWLEDAKYEAREEGLAEGREEGREEGRIKAAFTSYQNCISRGMSREDALAISGLTEAELASIENK